MRRVVAFALGKQKRHHTEQNSNIFVYLWFLTCPPPFCCEHANLHLQVTTALGEQAGRKQQGETGTPHPVHRPLPTQPVSPMTTPDAGPITSSRPRLYQAIRWALLPTVHRAQHKSTDVNAQGKRRGKYKAMPPHRPEASDVQTSTATRATQRVEGAKKGPAMRSAIRQGLF